MLHGLRNLFTNISSVTLAVLVHVVAFGILVVNVNWTSSEAKPRKRVLIQAVTVDKKLVQAELEKIKADEKKRQDELKALEDKKVREKKKIAALEKKRKAQERKLKAQEKQRKAAKKKRKIEKAKLAKARKAEAKERKAEEAAALEKKRKAQKQKEEQQAREQMERELENALAAEEAATAAQTEVEHYYALIEEKVNRNWRIPIGYQPGLTSTLEVRLIPSGEVVSVRLLKKSGNPAFDQSVENAILKSSPFPLPPAEKGMFDQFREFEFTFNPDKKE